MRRTGAAKNTLKYRAGVLDRLARELPAGLLAATHTDLDEWHSRLNVVPSTISSYTSNVRRFYAWAIEHERLDVDPTTRLPRTKVPPRRPRPVPDADLRVAITCAPDPMRAWLVLAAFMGLRAMEIAGMRREDLVEIDGKLYLDGIGKGSKEFRLPVPVHVVPVLRPHLAIRSGPLWRTAPGGRPSRPIDVSKQSVAFFRRIGMPYGIHQLRHSFGTSLYRETKDVLLTQTLPRHSSPDTTRLYVETPAAHEVAAMDRLSARLVGKRAGRRRGQGRVA